METVRRLPIVLTCGVLLLQLLPVLAIAQEGRPSPAARCGARPKKSDDATNAETQTKGPSASLRTGGDHRKSAPKKRAGPRSTP